MLVMLAWHAMPCYALCACRCEGAAFAIMCYVLCLAARSYTNMLIFCPLEKTLPGDKTHVESWRMPTYDIMAHAYI